MRSTHTCPFLFVIQLVKKRLELRPNLIRTSPCVKTDLVALVSTSIRYLTTVVNRLELAANRINIVYSQYVGIFNRCVRCHLEGYTRRSVARI